MSKKLLMLLLAMCLLFVACQRQPQFVKVPETTGTVGEVHIEIQQPPAGQAVNTNIGTPTLEILSPTEGEILTGGTVTVQVKVSNFNLVDYTKSKTAVPGEGHLHFFLDGGQYSFTYFPRYTYTNVANGEHEITVMLVSSDHTNVKGAEKKVKFVMKSS